MEHIQSSAVQLTIFARARFQYSDCLDDQQIRLLELKFGHSDEIVCLDVQTYSIHDYPPYIALSYTWGDPNDTVNVSCSGKILAVTRNLQEALWQFRENRKRLTRLESSATSCGQLLHFWVDAICIDQECNKEKSFQVGMMANIYQQARHVFTWLGPADESSDVAIRCIDTIGKMAEHCGLDHSSELCHRVWHEMAFGSTGTEQLLSADAVIIETKDGSLARVFWKAAKDLFDTVSGWNSQDNLLPITKLRNLFTRPWWTRIWVLQEIALSNDTYLICGTQRLPRARYTAFINVYHALWVISLAKYQRDQKSLTDYHRDILQQEFHRLPHILVAMPRIYRSGSCQLVAILHTTSIFKTNDDESKIQKFESSKPEDRIFALLGLAADRDELKRQGVVPNYDVPYQQTYAITMAALLQQGHIFLLSMCQQPSRSTGLPSWVPDWSRPINDTLQEPTADPVVVGPKFSCSGHRTNTNSTIKVLDHHGMLSRISINSYLYDEIYQVGCFSHRGDQDVSSRLQRAWWPMDWLLEILRLSYRRTTNYKGFHNRLRASARTCIGETGCGIDGDRERVRNDRYFNAVWLLREGLQHIEKGRFKIDAQRFLANQTVKTAFKERDRNQDPLVKEIRRTSPDRLPFVTRKGHIGLGSQQIMPGDVIAIIPGAQVPFVFRREDKGQFSLISEAYVDGIMDGEVADTGDYNYVTLI